MCSMMMMMIVMMMMMMMGSINAHKKSPFLTDSAGCTAVPVDKCDAKNNCLGTFFRLRFKRRKKKNSTQIQRIHTLKI